MKEKLSKLLVLAALLLLNQVNSRATQQNVEHEGGGPDDTNGHQNTGTAGSNVQENNNNGNFNNVKTTSKISGRQSLPLPVSQNVKTFKPRIPTFSPRFSKGQYPIVRKMIQRPQKQFSTFNMPNPNRHLKAPSPNRHLKAPKRRPYLSTDVVVGRLSGKISPLNLSKQKRPWSISEALNFNIGRRQSTSISSPSAGNSDSKIIGTPFPGKRVENSKKFPRTTVGTNYVRLPKAQSPFPNGPTTTEGKVAQSGLQTEAKVDKNFMSPIKPTINNETVYQRMPFSTTLDVKSQVSPPFSTIKAAEIRASNPKSLDTNNVKTNKRHNNDGINSSWKKQPTVTVGYDLYKTQSTSGKYVQPDMSKQLSTSGKYVQPDVRKQLSTSGKYVQPDMSKQLSTFEKHVQPDVSKQLSTFEKHVQPDMSKQLSTFEKHYQPDVSKQLYPNMLSSVSSTDKLTPTAGIQEVEVYNHNVAMNVMTPNFVPVFGGVADPFFVSDSSNLVKETKPSSVNPESQYLPKSNNAIRTHRKSSMNSKGDNISNIRENTGNIRNQKERVIVSDMTQTEKDKNEKVLKAKLQTNFTTVDTTNLDNYRNKDSNIPRIATYLPVQNEAIADKSSSQNFDYTIQTATESQKKTAMGQRLTHAGVDPISTKTVLTVKGPSKAKLKDNFLPLTDLNNFDIKVLGNSKDTWSSAGNPVIADIQSAKESLSKQSTMPKTNTVQSESLTKQESGQTLKAFENSSKTAQSVIGIRPRISSSSLAGTEIRLFSITTPAVTTTTLPPETFRVKNFNLNSWITGDKSAPVLNVSKNPKKSSTVTRFWTPTKDYLRALEDIERRKRIRNKNTIQKELESISKKEKNRISRAINTHIPLISVTAAPWYEVPPQAASDPPVPMYQDIPPQSIDSVIGTSSSKTNPGNKLSLISSNSWVTRLRETPPATNWDLTTTSTISPPSIDSLVGTRNYDINVGSTGSSNKGSSSGTDSIGTGKTVYINAPVSMDPAATAKPETNAWANQQSPVAASTTRSWSTNSNSGTHSSPGWDQSTGNNFDSNLGSQLDTNNNAKSNSWSQNSGGNRGSSSNAVSTPQWKQNAGSIASQLRENSGRTSDWSQGSGGSTVTDSQQWNKNAGPVTTKFDQNAENSNNWNPGDNTATHSGSQWKKNSARNSESQWNSKTGTQLHPLTDSGFTSTNNNQNRGSNFASQPNQNTGSNSNWNQNTRSNSNWNRNAGSNMGSGQQSSDGFNSNSNWNPNTGSNMGSGPASSDGFNTNSNWNSNTGSNMGSGPASSDGFNSNSNWNSNTGSNMGSSKTPSDGFNSNSNSNWNPNTDSNMGASQMSRTALNSNSNSNWNQNARSSVGLNRMPPTNANSNLNANWNQNSGSNMGNRHPPSNFNSNSNQNWNQNSGPNMGNGQPPSNINSNSNANWNQNPRSDMGVGQSSTRNFNSNANANWNRNTAGPNAVPSQTPGNGFASNSNWNQNPRPTPNLGPPQPPNNNGFNSNSNWNQNQGSGMDSASNNMQTSPGNTWDQGNSGSSSWNQNPPGSQITAVPANWNQPANPGNSQWQQGQNQASGQWSQASINNQGDPPAQASLSGSNVNVLDPDGLLSGGVQTLSRGVVITKPEPTTPAPPPPPPPSNQWQPQNSWNQQPAQGGSQGWHSAHQKGWVEIPQSNFQRNFGNNFNNQPGPPHHGPPQQGPQQQGPQQQGPHRGNNWNSNLNNNQGSPNNRWNQNNNFNRQRGQRPVYTTTPKPQTPPPRRQPQRRWNDRRTEVQKRKERQRQIELRRQRIYQRRLNRQMAVGDVPEGISSALQWNNLMNAVSGRGLNRQETAMAMIIDLT